MTSTIEPSRKHGPFDPRGGQRRLHVVAAGLATATTSLEDVPARLDWDGFSKRSFPERGRHDLERLSAYDAYTHGRPWRKQPPE